jgi:hypothetical protein
MENAHLRMGLLEYERYTEKIATRIRVRVSHYIGEDEEAHLLSVFGNDSDIGAITAAIYEQARFRLTFPSGETQEISLGEGAICHRGSISIPGRKQSVRHMVALSEELRGVKSLSRIFVLQPEPNEVWTALVHRFGLPGLPEWAERMTVILRENGRIRSVDSIGCSAAEISAACEELLGWLEVGIRDKVLRFPEANGPIRWPGSRLLNALQADMATLHSGIAGAEARRSDEAPGMSETSTLLSRKPKSGAEHWAAVKACERASQVGTEIPIDQGADRATGKCQW